jgi:hypothetical protein
LEGKGKYSLDKVDVHRLTAGVGPFLKSLDKAEKDDFIDKGYFVFDQENIDSDNDRSRVFAPDEIQVTMKQGLQLTNPDHTGICDRSNFRYLLPRTCFVRIVLGRPNWLLGPNLDRPMYQPRPQHQCDLEVALLGRRHSWRL